jgi:hypothetical protein
LAIKYLEVAKFSGYKDLAKITYSKYVITILCSVKQWCDFEISHSMKHILYVPFKHKGDTSDTKPETF